MVKTVGEAIKLMSKISDIADVTSQSTDVVEAFVNHRFREEMILPYVGITPNISFLMSCGERWVTTSDRIHCKVIEFHEKHICQLEDDIRRLYGIEPYEFIKRWYRVCNYMDSMRFVHIKLKKQEM